MRVGAHDDFRESRDSGLHQPASDEEAQLLSTEQFEFEEDDYHVKPRRFDFFQTIAGPSPHRIQKIEPFFPSTQRRLIRRLDSYFPTPRTKSALIIVFLFLWIAAFSIPLYIGNRAIKDTKGDYVVNLDCVHSLWRRKNFCGLDGLDCRPFNNTSFAFRCPANCAQVQVLNPRAVGPLDVVYRPLVIGDGIYRADSFICGSAIHAGVVSDSKGGCGRLSRVGEQMDIASVERNGISSIPFDSNFPSSFTFSTEDDIKCGKDPRQTLLYISVLFTVIFSLFTKSPTLQFSVIFLAIFTHVGLASDPPSASKFNVSVLPDHISSLVGRLLPATFCAAIIYHTSVKRTLSGLEAQFEKVLFWLGGFWLGALSNYTLEWIPINRLTAHDLEQQPGAKVALAIIVLLLLLIVCQQVYVFWLENRLLPYLALYGLFILGIIFFIAIPDLDLRIHHYILALLLLPGTSVQTRSSLLYQGILLGLFVNGIARWGFDSVLQTADDLRQDGSFDSLVPVINTPIIETTLRGSNISFSWKEPPVPTLDGISILVNDVERFRRFFTETIPVYNFSWTRPAAFDHPEYFRFAYIRDGTTLDYTQPGAWLANGTWSMQGEGSA